MAQNQPLHEQLQRPLNRRRAMGKMQRKDVPRGSHGSWLAASVVVAGRASVDSEQ